MKLSLAKKYNKKISRAIAEFELIKNNDNILVGISGGKDSTFLLYALKVLQGNIKPGYSLTAVTVDQGYRTAGDLKNLQDFCRRLGIEYIELETGMAEYLDGRQDLNPCARCSYLRKGVMADFASTHGYNKLALGHHYDDAVVTFLLSIIYSGQITTIQPRQYLSRRQINLIRPLIYLREKEIEDIADRLNFVSPRRECPYAGTTKRSEIRNRFDFVFRNKQLFYNIAAAMREGATCDLWPEKIPGDCLAERISKLWKD